MGYEIFVENLYISSALFPYLTKSETASCATVHKNCVKFKKTFTSENLQRNETAFCKNGSIVTLRSLGKKDGYFLSVMHKPHLIPTKTRHREGNPIQKQKLVGDYSLHMDGLDRTVLIIVNYSSVGKSHHRTTIVLRQFLEAKIFNAFVLSAIKMLLSYSQVAEN